MQRIDAIFAVERTTNGLIVAQRLEVRQARLALLVDALERWMRDARAQLSRQAPVDAGQ